MKEVGILTLFRSFNHGAYLQAYAMQKYLISSGLKVCFLNIYNWSENYKLAKTLIKRRTGDTKELVFNFHKYKLFREAWKNFNVDNDIYFSNRKHFDMIVVGSDEIWNIKNTTFNAIPEFYGTGLNSDKIIAYAPGAAATTVEDTRDVDSIAKGIAKFSHLSARDKNANDIAAYYTGRDIPLVVDPVLLVDYQEEVEPTEMKGYILVYSYRLPVEHRDEIRQFAKSRGLKLVSVGFYSDWCDINLNISPFQFLGVTQSADYVITDTFHGTIFSLLFKKKVAIYAGQKKKVMDMLTQYGFMGRLAGAGNKLESILDYDPELQEWEKLYGAIDRSKSYLNEAIAH